jgi:hypothetical protein
MRFSRATTVGSPIPTTIESPSLSSTNCCKVFFALIPARSENVKKRATVGAGARIPGCTWFIISPACHPEAFAKSFRAMMPLSSILGEKFSRRPVRLWDRYELDF